MIFIKTLFILLDITNLSDQFDQMVQRMTTVLYNLQHKENRPFIADSDEFIQVVEDYDNFLCEFLMFYFNQQILRVKIFKHNSSLKKDCYTLLSIS